jgi:hypothetical protein
MRENGELRVKKGGEEEREERIGRGTESRKRREGRGKGYDFVRSHCFKIMAKIKYIQHRGLIKAN